MLIDARFNGPPTSAHGGVACGVFASGLDARAASVRLVKPPPLDVELDAVPDGGDMTMVGPGGVVATVRPLPDPFDVEPLPRPATDDVAAARQFWIDNIAPQSVFPTCFGCGHARPDGDGLRLFAGEASVSGLCTDFWTPDPRDGDGSRDVPAWLVWAAIDCPSGAGAMRGLDPEGLQAVVLGELAVRIDELPRFGETYQVVARHAGRAGRRFIGEVGVVDGRGTNLAVGRATWVGIPQG